MSREKCLKELYQSLTVGGLITLIIFAFSHSIFTNPGEVITFWAGTQMVATYAVWTVIDIRDRKRP